MREWKGIIKFLFLSIGFLLLLSGCSKDEKVEIPASAVKVIDGGT
ncbi:hypothetical protein [Thermoactinomyces sp. CICC 10522]|nr:hypothetical protein [Thermoactinomyces sp. CICC 10522]